MEFDNMKIQKETTVILVNKERRSVRTIIPTIFTDIMDIKPGDTLLWEMSNENEIKLRKK